MLHVKKLKLKERRKIARENVIQQFDYVQKQMSLLEIGSNRLTFHHLDKLKKKFEWYVRSILKFSFYGFMSQFFFGSLSLFTVSMCVFFFFHCIFFSSMSYYVIFFSHSLSFQDVKMKTEELLESYQLELSNSPKKWSTFMGNELLISSSRFFLHFLSLSLSLVSLSFSFLAFLSFPLSLFSLSFRFFISQTSNKHKRYAEIVPKDGKERIHSKRSNHRNIL